MRNTKKNRETEKQLRMAINTECERVYGKKIGTNAAKFDWDLRLMPQPNCGNNWAYVSWNDFDCIGFDKQYFSIFCQCYYR